VNHPACQASSDQVSDAVQRTPAGRNSYLIALPGEPDRRDLARRRSRVMTAPSGDYALEELVQESGVGAEVETAIGVSCRL